MAQSRLKFFDVFKTIFSKTEKPKLEYGGSLQFGGKSEDIDWKVIKNTLYQKSVFSVNRRGHDHGYCEYCCKKYKYRRTCQ